MINFVTVRSISCQTYMFSSCFCQVHYSSSEINPAFFTSAVVWSFALKLFQVNLNKSHLDILFTRSLKAIPTNSKTIKRAWLTSHLVWTWENKNDCHSVWELIFMCLITPHYSSAGNISSPQFLLGCSLPVRGYWPNDGTICTTLHSLSK